MSLCSGSLWCGTRPLLLINMSPLISSEVFQISNLYDSDRVVWYFYYLVLFLSWGWRVKITMCFVYSSISCFPFLFTELIFHSFHDPDYELRMSGNCFSPIFHWFFSKFSPKTWIYVSTTLNYLRSPSRRACTINWIFRIVRCSRKTHFSLKWKIDFDKLSRCQELWVRKMICL